MLIRFGSRTGDRHDFQIGPQGSLFLESAEAEAFETGYAILEADHNVGAAAIFSQYELLSGALVTEVAVTASTLQTRFLVYVENREGYNTGIALANVNAVPSGVGFMLRPNGGGGDPIPGNPKDMDPGGHWADLIAGPDQLYPEFQGTGTLEVSATQPVPAVALRLTGRTLTALPVIPIP
ncbi:MAG: hypothetical protein FJW35_12555 [Acidobacteria bacterium]|nr:hypothetical protein [Acidobacteriota bacterium]